MDEHQLRDYFKKFSDRDTDFWEINKVMSLMRERPLTLSQVSISSKTFADWKKNDLIPFYESKDTRYWVKLNLTEYVWLKIIESLRGFGVSYEVLGNIKSFWFTPLYKKHYHEKLKEGNADYVPDLLIALMKAMKTFKSPEAEMTTEKVLKSISKADIIATSDIFGSTKYCFLDDYIIAAAKKGFQATLVFKNNGLYPICPEIDANEELKTGNYISISIYNIIDDLITNKKLPREDKTKLLGEKELLLLEEFKKIKEKNNKKSIVEINSDGYVIREIVNLPNDLNIAEECRKFPHQTITIEIQDYKKVKVTRTIKKMIKHSS